MARLALSPRSAIFIAVVVLLIVGVVAVVTARASGAGSVSTVTGAPGVPSAAASSSGTTPDASGARGTGAAGAGAGAGSPSSSSSSPRDGGVVLVHVAGAVAEPGLVRLRTGARVQQALRAAGGAVGDADLARVNLAEPVADGQRLYVPHVGETEIPQVLEPTDGTGGGTAAGAGAGAGAGTGAAPGGAPAGPGADGDSSAIDLNTADQPALETLPGIGPALAQRIVAWRDEHGAFTSVEDLLQVSGIGDARLADLRPRVRV